MFFKTCIDVIKSNQCNVEWLFWSTAISAFSPNFNEANLAPVVYTLV